VQALQWAVFDWDFTLDHDLVGSGSLSNRCDEGWRSGSRGGEIGCLDIKAMGIGTVWVLREARTVKPARG